MERQAPKHRVILLPVDGSAAAQAAARFAEDIARSEAESVLVLGVAVDLEPGESPSALEGAVADYIRRQVGEEAERIRASGIAAEEIVVEADTAQGGILCIARERAVDMIVMGTQGTTGWRRAVIGSVADAVIRESSVPVVLVPHREG